ncbi:hypothetical protein [Priestia megaterium]|uniref:hypothetical protein n=1 Tax=Priestia megaterium TaxID=1404 RepID=UPI002D7FBC27|nr:hypothetical protein [Priestia megaterium]MEB4856097.1 hypothetical protein [Priestia megaterium]
MSLGEEQKLYIQQFKEWLNEQSILQKQIERDIEAKTELIESNEKQLELHIQRINIGIKEHNKWAEDNGIEERIELIDECSLTEEEQREIELRTFIGIYRMVQEQFNVEVRAEGHEDLIVKDLLSSKEYWINEEGISPV